MNAGYYIEILETKRTLREVFTVCMECAARSCDDLGDATDLLTDVEAQISAIAKRQANAGLRGKLAALAFDVAHPPPRPDPVFKLGDATIATPGNIEVIQAQAKAGKSAALQGMMASAMEPAGDCLGFSSANPHGYALLHLDTEQSDADHDESCRRVLQRAGRSAPPAWFVSYRVTVLTIPERFAALRMELDRLKARHGGILAVILDGAADLGHDPNDTKEAFAIVDELHRLAVQYQTVIVCVLHENPGTETAKTRGHLGSQLERKAETNLRLEKNADNVTVMFCVRGRHAHIPKERGARFEWSQEASMHVSTEAPFAAKGTGGHFNALYSKDQVLGVLSVIEGMEPRELYRQMDERFSMSRATAKRFLAALKAAGKVEQRDEKLYLAAKTK